MAERVIRIYPWRIVRWFAFGAAWAFPMYFAASAIGLQWDWKVITFCIFASVWTQIVDVVESAARAVSQGEG